MPYPRSLGIEWKTDSRIVRPTLARPDLINASGTLEHMQTAIAECASKQYW